MILLESDSFRKCHEFDDREKMCLADTQLYDVYVRLLIYKKEKKRKKNRVNVRAFPNCVSFLFQIVVKLSLNCTLSRLIRLNRAMRKDFE